MCWKASTPAADKRGAVLAKTPCYTSTTNTRSSTRRPAAATIRRSSSTRRQVVRSPLSDVLTGNDHGPRATLERSRDSDAVVRLARFGSVAIADRRGSRAELQPGRHFDQPTLRPYSQIIVARPGDLPANAQRVRYALPDLRTAGQPSIRRGVRAVDAEPCSLRDQNGDVAESERPLLGLACRRSVLASCRVLDFVSRSRAHREARTEDPVLNRGADSRRIHGDVGRVVMEVAPVLREDELRAAAERL